MTSSDSQTPDESSKRAYDAFHSSLPSVQNQNRFGLNERQQRKRRNEVRVVHPVGPIACFYFFDEVLYVSQDGLRVSGRSVVVVRM